MFIGILIGFTLVTLIYSISYGALETIKTKAARYFSGHISITGYPILEDPEDVISIIKNSGLPIRTVAPRTIYYRENAALFFGANQ